MIVTKAEVIENSPAVFCARVMGSDGTLIVPSGVTSITVKSFDKDTAQLVATVTPIVADSVYSTLRLGDVWTADGLGFNIALLLPGSCWPEAGSYSVEAKIVPTAGQPFYILYDVEAVNIYSE